MDREMTIHGTAKKARFIKLYGDIYEHSAWVAKKTWDHTQIHGDGKKVDIFNIMKSIVEAADYNTKLLLLQRHPDLGVSETKSKTLSNSSLSEQSGVGLINCTEAEFKNLNTLNKNYKTKFGFPFIIAVVGLSKTEIIQAIENRIHNSHQVEFVKAIQQVHKIAQLRIKVLQNAPPS